MAYVCSIAGVEGDVCSSEPTHMFGWLPVCSDHRAVLFDCSSRETEQWMERENAKEARAREISVVYYLQRSDDCIKIGYTTRLRDRQRALEAEHGPLSLLAWHWGHRESEGAQHGAFAEDRIEGEWFLPSDELLEHIAHVRARHGKEPPRQTSDTDHSQFCRHGEPLAGGGCATCQRRCQHGHSRKSECSTCRCESNARRKRQLALTGSA